MLPEYWNKRLTSGASETFLKYLLEQVNDQKIRDYSHPNNISSIRVAEKIGMRDMGIIFLKP